MKTKVPYTRDTHKYYVFEQEFQPGQELRVSVYVLKTSCPNQPINGSEIEVTIEPVNSHVDDALDTMDTFPGSKEW